jgi:hypothetical protein
MKEKFNHLVDQYKKSASDSSSNTLKLMKLKVFKNTIKDFQKLDNQKELHDFLLSPSDDIDKKLASKVLFRVMFKDEFEEISSKIKHDDFVQYHEKHPSATSLDYFFTVAGGKDKLFKLDHIINAGYKDEIHLPTKFRKKQEREKIIKDSINKVMEKGELVGRVKGEIGMVQFLFKSCEIDQEKIKNYIQFLDNKRYVKYDLEEILGYIKHHKSDDVAKIFYDLGFSNADDLKLSDSDYIDLSNKIKIDENI